MRSHLLVILAWLTSAFVVACGGDAGPTNPPPGEPEVAVVEVTPSADTLTALGAVAELSARALDASGREITGVTITWATSDGAVISISEEGVATAVGNGAAEVRATADGVTGTAQLAVLQRVAAVAVTPSSATLTTAGASQPFSAEATDENGNPVADARLVWDSEDPTVATVDSSGTATSKSSGRTTITATAQGIPGYAELTVNQLIAQFEFVTEPTDARAGEAIDPAVRVEVLDSAGNRVEDAEIAITLGLAANTGGSTLHGTRTVTSTAGVATFPGVWLDKVGTGYTMSATAPGTVQGATSAGFSISPATAAELAFMTHPGDVTAGEAITPAVEVEVQDDYGNTVTAGPDSVRVSIGVNVGGGTLSGTRRAATVNGRAVFGDLSIDRSGTDYRLSAEAGVIDPQLSGMFDVSAAAPARVRFVTEPSATRGQAAFHPDVVVEVEDRFGNPTVQPVSLSLESHPSHGRLVGTVTRTPEDGQASFDGVAPDNPGAGYTMRATSGSADTVSAPFDVAVDFVQLSGGFHLTCGVTALGKAYCWGRDDFDQVGSGSRTGDACTSSSLACHQRPMAVAGGLDVESVDAGLISACALTTAGEAYCWGDNGVGALGDGTTDPSSTPVPVGGGHTFTKLAVGVDYACGLTAGGQAYCWGTDQLGQLGDGAGSVNTCTTSLGTVQCSTLPTAVAGGLTFDDLVAGEAFACGITSGGQVHCWGKDEMGQLGDGASSAGTCTSISGASVPCSESPTAVATATTYATVTAGQSHACSLTAAGEAFCWGANHSNQLNGDSAVTETCLNATTSVAQPCATSPVAVNDTVIHLQAETVQQFVDGIEFTSITAIGAHTCGVGSATASGSDVYSGPLCWGSNSAGQTGNGGSGGTVYTPTEVVGGASMTRLVGGFRHTCAVLTDGTAYCWGRNGYGQIGDGTTTDRSIPTRIVQ